MVPLGDSFTWLAETWALVLLGAALVVEIALDKIAVRSLLSLGVACPQMMPTAYIKQRDRPARQGDRLKPQMPFL